MNIRISLNKVNADIYLKPIRVNDFIITES
ncbi:hypothetical protein J2S11_002087 [Bacillus horti]|uniref:Uncharacterized protein n=1 Tax=Caldalkalibacillus horti TaxID=77523 RepID=A0ABT9VYW5_9BACI|nr:hypothetical protein [Bacillus horti]